MQPVKNSKENCHSDIEIISPFTSIQLNILIDAKFLQEFSNCLEFYTKAEVNFNVKSSLFGRLYMRDERLID